MSLWVLKYSQSIIISDYLFRNEYLIRLLNSRSEREMKKILIQIFIFMLPSLKNEYSLVNATSVCCCRAIDFFL